MFQRFLPWADRLGEELLEQWQVDEVRGKATSRLGVLKENKQSMLVTESWHFPPEKKNIETYVLFFQTEKLFFFVFGLGFRKFQVICGLVAVLVIVHSLLNTPVLSLPVNNDVFLRG